MRVKNGPALCPHCHSLSAYYEIDRLAAIRDSEKESAEWKDILSSHKKSAFCLMCHHTIEIPEDDSSR